MPAAADARRTPSSNLNERRNDARGSICALGFGLTLAVLACGSSKTPPRPEEQAGDGTAGNSAELGGAGNVVAGASGGTAAGTAGSSPGGGGSPGMQPNTCPELMDPQDNCPKGASAPGAACTSVAICDYDVCDDGCVRTLVCEQNRSEWTGAINLCGGSCERVVAEKDPWQRTRTLSFVELDGSCGKLGGLELDPIANKLGALSCVVQMDEHNGCVFHRAFDCSLEETQLKLDLRVTHREGRGYRGEAKVRVSGSASPCTSEYLVAL